MTKIANTTPLSRFALAPLIALTCACASSAEEPVEMHESAVGTGEEIVLEGTCNRENLPVRVVLRRDGSRVSFERFAAIRRSVDVHSAMRRVDATGLEAITLDAEGRGGYAIQKKHSDTCRRDSDPHGDYGRSSCVDDIQVELAIAPVPTLTYTRKRWISMRVGGQLRGERNDIVCTATARSAGRVRDIAAGNGHACVALADGHVECWGDNTRGQLGDGTTVSRPTPACFPRPSSAGATRAKCFLLPGRQQRVLGEREQKSRPARAS